MIVGSGIRRYLAARHRPVGNRALRRSDSVASRLPDDRADPGALGCHPSCVFVRNTSPRLSTGSSGKRPDSVLVDPCELARRPYLLARHLADCCRHALAVWNRRRCSRCLFQCLSSLRASAGREILGSDRAVRFLSGSIIARGKLSFHIALAAAVGVPLACHSNRSTRTSGPESATHSDARRSARRPEGPSPRGFRRHEDVRLPVVGR